MFQSVSNYISAHPQICLAIAFLLVFAWAVARYSKTRRWAHAPVLLGELKSFRESHAARIMDDFFTYRSIETEIDADGETHRLHVNSENLRWLLRPADHPGGFTAAEIAFRKMFDEYLAGIARIGWLYQVRLADKTMVNQHAGKLVEALGKRKPKSLPLHTIQAVQNYLVDTKQNSVIRLLGTYGYWFRYNAKLADYESAKPQEN